MKVLSYLSVSDLRLMLFIKAAIIAVHNDNHHFNLDLLEKELPSRLAEKFGDQSWWPEKGIAIDLKN